MHYLKLKWNLSKERVLQHVIICVINIYDVNNYIVGTWSQEKIDI